MIRAELSSLWGLVAQSPLRSMSSKFRDGSAGFGIEDAVAGLFLLAGVSLLIFLLSRLRARQEKGDPYHNPWALFRELSKAHGLDRRERRLLKRLAADQNLAQPGLLFVDPTCFADDNLPPALRDEQEALEGIAARLFAAADSAPESEPELAEPARS